MRELEAQLDEVIGGVDETLEQEQRRTASGRDASSTGGGFPTSDGRAGSGATGSGGYAAEGASGEEGSGDGEGTAGGQGGSDGVGDSDGGEESTSGGGMGGASSQRDSDSSRGNVPTYDEDPDTFRRQICEAAGAERDPALREALERECRKYGGTPAGG